MHTDRDLKIVKSVRIWGSPVFKDSVMTEDIAGALLANNDNCNCVLLGYAMQTDTDSVADSGIMR